jgi:hypothetical protein
MTAATAGPNRPAKPKRGDTCRRGYTDHDRAYAKTKNAVSG